VVGAILKFDKWSKNIFRVIFKNIDISLWNFNIMFWESYGNNTLSSDFNGLDNIDSNLAKQELVYYNSEVYPEFLELFLSRGNTIINPIKTYDDFIDSNYFMSIVIIDHRNIEICCKDMEVLKKIIINFSESGLENKRINILKKIKSDAIISAYRSRNDKNIYD